MIPSFAEELCNKDLNFLDDACAFGINLTADMHKRGIGVRHMGLLRDMFWRPLQGNVDLSFDSNRVRTRTDMRSQLRRGDKVSKNLSTAHICNVIHQGSTPDINKTPAIDRFEAEVEKSHLVLPLQVRIDGQVYTISVEPKHQFSACTITLDRKVSATRTSWIVIVGVDESSSVMTTKFPCCKDAI